MPAFASQTHLIDRLPTVRGRLTANAPLSQRTWFRVGGPAEVLFVPADGKDLSTFIQQCPKDVPRTVLGAASNLLVRDGGIPGVIIKLGSVFSFVEDVKLIEQDAHGLWVGAATLDSTVTQTAFDLGLTGLEFLSGVPGMIGGAVFMNAGCYGREISDVVDQATVMMPDGETGSISAAELGLSYRHSTLPEGSIVLSATFRAEPGDPAVIAARLAEIRAAREDTQPQRVRTGGSTFANPEGQKAWQLIDAAGCRGLRIGGAQVSEKHCNFLLNTGEATAADLEALGEEVRRRVADTSGLELRWEIQRVGVAG